MSHRLTRIVIALVVVFVTAAGIGGYQIYRQYAAATAGRYDSIGGPFELVDQTGRPVTRDSFAGDYVLMSFGFTSCPDVCPTELSRMATTMDLLGADAERVRPVFITVDPERDTAAALADYVGRFHPRMIGLTGTPEQVAAAARAYRVYYDKVEQEGGHYTMDHSTFLYLLGPDGRTLEVLSHGTSPDELADRIRDRMGV